MTPRPPMGSFNFRAPKELVDAAKVKAEVEGKHLSEIIRAALERYVNKK